MMDAVSASERMANFYQTTWHNIPDRQSSSERVLSAMMFNIVMDEIIRKVIKK
jgi:hypothetical protein